MVRPADDKWHSPRDVSWDWLCEVEALSPWQSACVHRKRSLGLPEAKFVGFEQV